MSVDEARNRGRGRFCASSASATPCGSGPASPPGRLGAPRRSDRRSTLQPSGRLAQGCRRGRAGVREEGPAALPPRRPRRSGRPRLPGRAAPAGTRGWARAPRGPGRGPSSRCGAARPGRGGSRCAHRRSPRRRGRRPAPPRRAPPTPGSRSGGRRPPPRPGGRRRASRGPGSSGSSVAGGSPSRFAHAARPPDAAGWRPRRRGPRARAGGRAGHRAGRPVVQLLAEDLRVGRPQGGRAVRVVEHVVDPVVDLRRHVGQRVGLPGREAAGRSLGDGPRVGEPDRLHRAVRADAVGRLRVEVTGEDDGVRRSRERRRRARRLQVADRRAEASRWVFAKRTVAPSHRARRPWTSRG